MPSLLDRGGEKHTVDGDFRYANWETTKIDISTVW
jgi:hypothetical protein